MISNSQQKSKMVNLLMKMFIFPILCDISILYVRACVRACMRWYMRACVSARAHVCVCVFVCWGWGEGQVEYGKWPIHIFISSYSFVSSQAQSLTKSKQLF